MMDELQLEELSARMMLVKMDDAFCQALQRNQRRHGERGRRLKAAWHQKSKNSDSRLGTNGRSVLRRPRV